MSPDQRRAIRRRALSLLLLSFAWIFTADSVGAARSPPQSDLGISAGYWEGELVAQGRVWQLALDVDPERETPVLLDVPSIWRIGLKVPSILIEDGSITFDLPWRIGAVQARIAGTTIEGRARLTNGDIGILRLERSDPTPTRTRELEIRNGSIRLAASMIAPVTPGPHPAVVVLHGGGDSSREESPPYRFWGKYLARRGYVVLLYDKRGNGKSEGDWRKVGFEERAGDVSAAVTVLRRQEEVDPSRVGLLAVSQGSWVAGLVARQDPDLRFVVNVSGPAVSVEEADTYALRSELERRGWSAVHIGERLALWRMIVDYTASDGDPELWKRLGEAEDWARTRSWPGDEPFEIGDRDSWWKGWYGRVASHDPLPLLERLETPMLWLYGEHDTESDVVRNLAILEDLRQQDQKDYSIVVFPGAGHGLLVPVSPTGEDRPPLTTASGFFEILLHWLDRF